MKTTEFAAMYETPFGSRHRYLFALLVSVLVFSTAFAQAPAEKEEEVDPATKDLVAANRFYSSGRFKFAAQKYEGFLQRYPKHKEVTAARYGLAICQWKLQKFDEASKSIVQVLADSKFDRPDEALVVLGHCYMSTNQRDKALTTFVQLRTKHPKSKHTPTAALNEIQVLYLLDRKKESAAASQQFLKSYATHGNAATALYFLALSSHDLNDPAATGDAAEKLLKEHPNSRYQLDATLLLGQSLEAQGNFKDATAQYRELLRLAPLARQPEALYSLGVVLYRSADYKESDKVLSELLSKHKQSSYAAPALMQLGLTQLANGDTSKARTTLSSVSKNDEQRRTTASYWLSQCDIAEKEFDTALKTLSVLAKLNPPPANIEQIKFDHAVCRMSLEQFPEAATEFNQFRRAYPKSKQTADALYREAYCLHQTKKYDESLALCAQIGKLGETSVARSSAELAAENLFLLAKYEPASQAYKLLLNSAKDGDEKQRVTFRLGQCAYHTRDFSKAIVMLKPLADDSKIAKHEQLRESIFLYGDALLQTSQYKESAAALAKYLKITSKKDRDEPQFKLALAQLRNGDNENAAKNLAAVMAGNTESPWVQSALFEYGQLQYKAGDPAKAKLALAKVLTTKASEKLTAPATYLLAWIEFDAGKYSEAAVGFGQMISKHPGHDLVADAIYQQAISLVRDGKFDDGLAAAQKYIKAYVTGKHVTQARYLKAKCLNKLNNHDEAVNILANLANNKTTATVSIFYDLAWSQRALKQNTEAEKSYRQLLSTYPQDKLAIPASAELAELLYQRDQIAEATTLLERVVANKDVESKLLGVANYQLGWCYVKQDQLSKAAPIFAAYAEANPKSAQVPSALYQAGMAYGKTGKIAEAQQQLGKLVKQFPKDELTPHGYLKLGQFQGDARLYDKSATTYTQFLAAFPKSEFVHLARFGVGWSLENRNRFDDARKSYQQVIDTYNGETAARAQFQIGECYFKEKKWEDAVRELLSVDAVYQYEKWSAKALYEAGVALEQLGQKDEAKKTYADCVKKYGKSGEATMAQKRLAALR